MPGLHSNPGLSDPIPRGPITNWNRFDAAILNGQQQNGQEQNTQGQDPPMANFLLTLSQAAPAILGSRERERTLILYLIQQQLCAGIPLDQLEIYPSQPQGPREEIFRNVRRPAVYDASEDGISIPIIPDAEVTGDMYPLPLHPWLPYPGANLQAHSANGTPVGNGIIDARPRRVIDPDLFINGPHANGTQGDTRTGRPVFNNVFDQRRSPLSFVNTNSNQSSSNNGRFNGSVGVMGSNFAATIDGVQTNNMASSVSSSNAHLDRQPMTETNTQLMYQYYIEDGTDPATARAILGNDAFLHRPRNMQDTTLANHTLSRSSNNSSIGNGYGQSMLDNGNFNGLHDLGHVAYGNDFILSVNTDQFNTAYVSRRPYRSAANGVSSNGFQNIGVSNGFNGSSLTSATTMPHGSTRSVTGNNNNTNDQIHPARSTNTHPNGINQARMRNGIHSGPNILDQAPLYRGPGEAPGTSIYDRLAPFFESQEEQRIVTDFFINHFSDAATSVSGEEGNVHDGEADQGALSTLSESRNANGNPGPSEAQELYEGIVNSEARMMEEMNSD
ncbi:hypothetical protein N7492_000604 [Penicillium capsulatum]|uniref:Uncharacterized protein n=1 Tax=Penicillium capsulatum TaxID=69766 RepID=A0A9W9IRK5_9EURO|nr:hypothetical protein N7492_000604 [Penicillium capsulatum]